MNDCEEPALFIIWNSQGKRKPVLYSGAEYEVADISYILEKSYPSKSDLSSIESKEVETSEFKCENG